jgi:hypothetical protein
MILHSIFRGCGVFVLLCAFIVLMIATAVFWTGEKFFRALRRGTEAFFKAVFKIELAP